MCVCMPCTCVHAWVCANECVEDREPSWEMVLASFLVWGGALIVGCCVVYSGLAGPWASEGFFGLYLPHCCKSAGIRYMHHRVQLIPRILEICAASAYFWSPIWLHLHFNSLKNTWLYILIRLGPERKCTQKSETCAGDTSKLDPYDLRVWVRIQGSFSTLTSESLQVRRRSRSWV